MIRCRQDVVGVALDCPMVVSAAQNGPVGGDQKEDLVVVVQGGRAHEAPSSWEVAHPSRGVAWGGHHQRMEAGEDHLGQPEKTNQWWGVPDKMIAKMQRQTRRVESTK